MNSNRKSNDRSTDDLRRVEPYKRSTKDKQGWLRSGRSSNQYSKMPGDEA